MQPDEIARGLTEAQKRALLTLTGHMEIPSCKTVSSNAYKSLNDAWGGILVATEWRVNIGPGPSHRRAYRALRLGLAVRAILENTDD